MTAAKEERPGARTAHRPLPSIALLISDVDGTLVRPDKSLSDSNVAAVAALHDAGVQFTLVSSRPPRGMAGVLKALKVSLPYAAFNGGVVLHADGTVAVTHRIPEDAAREAVDVLAAHGVDAWVFADDLWLVLKDSGRLVDKETMTLGYGPTLVDDFTPYLDRVDKMVGASDDHALLAQLEQRLAAQLAERATAVRSQPYYLDLTAPQANKGDAVVALAQLVGVDMAHVAVIGDADNDVPMFGKAGWAMAMGQGEAAVQARADVVTASNSDDGVAAAIHRYILVAASAQASAALLTVGTTPDATA